MGTANRTGAPMTTPADWYDTHRDLLDRATAAAAVRDNWSAYPESPSKSVYGEDAAASGERAFRDLLGGDFPIEVPGATGSVATERSPYGLELSVRYPRADPAALIAAARAAIPGWRAAGPRGRGGRDPAPAQRPHLRDRPRRAAHHRAGVRHGVPGRRRPRPGPRARGGGVHPGRVHPHA